MSVSIKSRKWGYTSLLFLFVVVIVLVGCSKDNTESNSSNINTEAVVNPELIAIGEKTAKTSCLPCHGRDLKGDMGPNLRNIALTDEQIMEVLIKGRGSMPPVTANGKEEAVIAYLRTLK